MSILYDLTFIIYGIIYIPYLILTKRYRYGIGDRMGFLPERLKSLCSKGRIIWIHAVSVGEMKAASILAPLLRKAFPSHTLVFSSVTHTGNKVAGTIATPEEGVFYLPFDISQVVNRVVGVIRPELFLCLETELWPNLISSLHGFGAKVILVNGRISDRSYFGYRALRPAVSRILNKFSLILMQSERDAARALALGAPKERVFATGNLKFDLLLGDSGDDDRGRIRRRLGIGRDDVLLIAGSTHKGEEEQVLGCFSKLRRDRDNLRLLIAPRHVERAVELEQLLTRCGFKAVRFSSLDGSSDAGLPDIGSRTVRILDTIGDLKTIYSASDVVFVGGSLVKKGGQNPIEPASMAKPVIFGRFMFNFQDVAKSFLENGAAIRVENREELYSAIRLLIDSSEDRRNFGWKAKDTVNRNSGAAQRTIDLILSQCRKFLTKPPVYNRI